jgi:hypothetical protein
MCTIEFNIQQFYILPIECVYFLCMSEQWVTWLIFITEMESADCAVRAESLNKIHQVSSLKG